ncbi:MAG: aldolase/citrate lyase family protein [Candidatus Latescibacterota bacterium]
MLAGTLKEKLRAGGRPIGLLMTFDFWAGYLEVCQRLGVDFVVLDMEHGQVDLSQAEHLCRTARLLDLPLLIRPPSSAAVHVKRSLDLGAGGVMVPWLETRGQLQEVHDAAFCPPRGRHGMGGPGILAVPGTRSADWARIEENTFLMCQIETPAGLQIAAEAARCDWLDALMVGPYDLAHTMGVVDHYLEAEEHLRAIDSIRAAAHAGGRWAGMVTGTGEDARTWFERGFDLVIIGAVLTHFVQGLTRNLQAARQDRG